MSTVAEIESAIERLAPAQVAELAAWFEEYQQMINTTCRSYCPSWKQPSPHFDLSSLPLRKTVANRLARFAAAARFRL